jgi:riboflavin kinase / FMN adenylyltransferase
MDVVSGVAALEARLGRLFLTIGVFDGLHLGHAYLLRHLVESADRLEAHPGVITFDAHPDEVLVGKAPPLLLDQDERLERLAAAGVEVTVVQPFDERVRHTPYDAFIRAISERVDLAGFLMTPDSAFGHERRGNAETVAALGRELGYEVVVVPSLTIDGHPVSSSEIRRRIAAGELDAAAGLLGRPYAVVGQVDDAGSMKFPIPVALPPAGAYAVDGTVLRIDGSACRIASRPPGRARVAFG